MWLKVLAWLLAGGIIGLNVWLVVRTVTQWGGLGRVPTGVSALLFALMLACGLLLLWISMVPLRGPDRLSPPAGKSKQKP